MNARKSRPEAASGVEQPAPVRLGRKTTVKEQAAAAWTWREQKPTWGQPEHPLHAFVAGDFVIGDVPIPQDQARSGQGHSQALFAVAQRSFNALVVGDILDRAHALEQAPLFVE